ncbi:MAG: peptide ABC transporter substrate-binding protein [Chloroflexota bacterium]
MSKLGSTLHRQRGFTLVALLLIMAMMVAGCVAAPEPAADAESSDDASMASDAGSDDPRMTIYGEMLPEDALPYEQQIYREACSNTANQTTFDFMVAVYQRFCSAGDGKFSDALIELDKDFNVVPGAAESWEVSEDGRTWTFHLREGQMWSDGTPLTAHDYVATFQYAADPEHGWDFTWFYGFLGPGGIQNWNPVIAGETSVEELGVEALDDLTFAITTEGVFPPLPGVMKFSWPLQKKALEEHGPFYNNDLETHVSSGPFILTEFDPGNRIVMEANPHYNGYRKPLLKAIDITYMAPETNFAAFENGEIDNVGSDVLTPADFELILADDVMSQNYLRHFGDFRTDYLLFDTFNPPFDNLDVRKAFAHAVDRDAIVSNVWGDIKAMPATTMLMPGYPSSDTEGNLAEYQAYDCDLANEHLAAAGFEGGEGFPPLEMWLRNEPPALAAVFQATAASISDCLSVNIEVSNKDNKVYNDAMNAKPTGLQFGAVSYGMDFLDPANLLGNVWHSSGRHSWKNDEFDALVTEASALVGDPETRDQMFRDAERILVDDVGGIFIGHRWAGNLVQPYVQGSAFREPDSQGIAGFHWGNDSAYSTLYISTSE